MRFGGATPELSESEGEGDDEDIEPILSSKFGEIHMP
jgi:hypothetical protein